MLCLVSGIWIATGVFAQSPTINSVVNPAGSGQAGVAVGSLATIFGSNLASGLAVSDSTPLSTTLSDVTSVTVNGTASPLVLVSGSRINAQIPWEVTPGPAAVVVNRAGGASTPVNITVNQFAPALISFNFGNLQAIAVNTDGSIAAPAGSLAGLNSHPAATGDTITLWATGLGPAAAGAVTGRPSPDASQQTVSLPVILIGGVQAQVTYAGLSTQYVGVYQVNIVIPSGVAAGNAVPVQIQAGDVTGPDTVTIAIQ